MSAHILEEDGGCRLRWNHNSAYYPELVSDAALRGGSALDVGCGDGTLLELLAGVCEHVVGVEADPAAARIAAGRVAQPRESLDEIRAVAGERLPGALVRRRLYWRYSLEWTKTSHSRRTLSCGMALSSSGSPRGDLP